VYGRDVSLFPSAPEVKIHAPANWFAGEMFAVQIEVIAKAETKVEYVEARVVAEQGWSVGSGKSRVSRRAKVFDHDVRLMQEGVLPVGSSAFTAQFGFPGSLPPTHHIEPAWVSCLLHVRVSIPWWPDGKYRFPIVLRRRVKDAIARNPTVMRSTRDTAPADTPRIELGLASTRLIAGEELTGSCALFHLDDRKPREVELSLVPSLTLLGARLRDRRGAPVATQITMPEGSAGKAIEFRITIPFTLTPGFVTVTHALRWHLVASSGSLFGRSVSLAVPLEIFDPTGLKTTPGLLAPPRVAEARVAAILAQFVTAAGWTESSEDGQPAIAREVDDSELRVVYSYRGEEGTFLVGRVTYPPLGLGLRVTPSSTLRHVFLEDIEIKVAAWDRAHHVIARSADQTVPFLRAAIGPALAAPALGDFVSWDDDGIVFERPVASLEATELAQLATALGQLALAIARARPTLVPPPGLAVDVAAWQELARWLHGSLAIGDLSIDGELDRMPVALGLEWDDDQKPRDLRVGVGHPDAASAAIREVTLALARPADQALDVTDQTLVERLIRWPADVVDLAVVDGVASASLVGTVDATRVRELVHELRGLLAALDPEAGPYR